MTEQHPLIPHLFRTEYSRIVSVLSKRFGFDQLEIAEDIASDTFLTAAQTWPLHGIPSHPVAWLYHVAKNKAKNWLQRESVFRNKVSGAVGADGSGTSRVAGYSGADEQDIDDQDITLRKDLCYEAMRLCRMLAENPLTNKPEVNALLSLMYFHASRFEARISPQGGMVLYDDQDTMLWDEELISQGGYYLSRSASGKVLSKYHLEASIAYWHCIKEDTAEKWENILQLYNLLLQVEYSPIAALNRTFALAKTNGKQAAIAEAEKLMLTDNHFYYTLLGELYTGIDNKKALAHFLLAFCLAKTTTDKQIIQKKIDRL